MSHLLELTKYILYKYPRLEELSKPRLVKVIYLIDWKFAIDYGAQYTDIDWIYNHYGPYVEDVIQMMEDRTDVFNVSSRPNPYGGTTHDFSLVNRKPKIDLEKNIQKTADFIMDKTADLNWTQFISLVYSTFPMKSTSRFYTMDLSFLSREFNQKNLHKN